MNGEDGWYEYAFQRETDHKPKILEDGSVDYSQYGNIPSVEEGDVIAVSSSGDGGEGWYGCTW